MAHGHPHARLYPINFLFEETQLVAERVNWNEATRAVLLQSAVGSLLSKENAKHFSKLLNRMHDGEQA